MDENSSNVVYTHSSTCPKCGKPFIYVGDPIGPVEEFICQCNVTKRRPDNMQFGWVCPICGTVNAPWAWTCANNHNPFTTTITWEITK